MGQPASHVSRARDYFRRLNEIVNEGRGVTAEYVALGGQPGIETFWYKRDAEGNVIEVDGDPVIRTDLGSTSAEFVSGITSVGAILDLYAAGHYTNLSKAQG